MKVVESGSILCESRSWWGRGSCDQYFDSRRVRKGEKGAYGELEREIPIENRFFPTHNRYFWKSIFRAFIEAFYVLSAILKSLVNSKICTKII